MTVDEYLASLPKPKAKKDNPEHREQCFVAAWLRANLLPEHTLFSADAAGVRVSPGVAKQMWEAGVERGWPDLRFLCADGVTRYIEMKSDVGSLRPEQRAFRDRCLAFDIWAVCRSLEAVQAVLARWPIPLRSVEVVVERPQPRRSRPARAKVKASPARKPAARRRA